MFDNVQDGKTNIISYKCLLSEYKVLYTPFQTSLTCLLHPTGGSCVMIFFTDSGHKGIFVV